MIVAPRPDGERERLTTLHALGVLDTPTSPELDAIVARAAALFDVPISLVSLVDADRQWFKARHGLEAAETDRSSSFCAHAILEPEEVLVVGDTAVDARFHDNPLVTGEPRIRFYAGAPLISSEGVPLGTLCVIDRRPRQVSREQLDHLRALSLQAAAEIERGLALQVAAPATEAPASPPRLPSRARWALFAVPLLLAAVLAALIERASTRHDEALERAARAASLLDAAERAVVDVQLALAGRDAGAAQQGALEVGATLQGLLASGSAVDEEQAAVQDALAAWEDVLRGEDALTRAQAAERARRSLESAAASRRRAATDQASSPPAAAWGTWAAIATPLLGALGALVLVRRSRRRLVTPLSQLLGAVGRVHHGELGVRVSSPAGAAQEVHQLVEGFNQLVGGLEHDRTRFLAQVQRDALTGLPNRRALLAATGEHLLAGHPVSLVLLDLDRFAAVNDRFGAEAGDQLLRVAAATLVRAAPPGAVVGRVGSDEFAVLVAGAQASAARVVADGLVSALLAEPAFGRLDLRLSACSGVATASGTPGGAGPAAEELLRDAALALAAAKRDGGGTRRAYEPALRAQLRDRTRAEEDLRRALDEGQLRLHHQPIVELADGRIVGFEALVRWLHPQQGLLPPASFIPLAEETGLVVPLGWWVLQTACEEVVRWDPRDAVRISVNLAPAQLASPDLLSAVERALGSSGLEPRRLVLELTESSMVANPARAATTLRRLSQLGVQVALDDFGTGWSSLAYLQALPIDIVKVDRTFVDAVTADDPRPPLLVSILEMVRRLGLEAVAEGIEHPWQRQALLDLGCRLGQGYLFSRPLPAVPASRLVRDGGARLGPRLAAVQPRSGSGSVIGSP